MNHVTLAITYIYTHNTRSLGTIKWTWTYTQDIFIFVRRAKCTCSRLIFHFDFWHAHISGIFAFARFIVGAEASMQMLVIFTRV